MSPVFSGVLTFPRHVPFSRAATVRQSTMTLVAVFVLGIVAIAPYAQTLHGYFIGDDFGLVRLFAYQPPLHFLSLLWQSWDENVYGNSADEIRPIIALSYQFDFFWGAGAPEAFHVTNILFHVFNSILVFLIGREIAGLSWVSALIAGSLFAILPSQAEAVSWISGRADLIPAFFYLAAFFAFAVWRTRHRSWVYVISVLLFCMALFSKQYAITMLLTIVLYDSLINGNVPQRMWRSVAAYVPFLAITLGFLGLRYLLFHNFVREGMFSLSELLTRIPGAQEENLEVLLFGRLPLLDLPEPPRSAARAACLLVIALGLVPAVIEWHRAGRVRPGAIGSVLAYFGPLWWLVTIAPLTVTYLTPRHLYLPAAGVAIALGLGFDLLQRTVWPAWSYLRWAAILVLGLTCVSGLESAVSDWTTAANMSGKMVVDLEREATRAPAGALVLVGAQPQAALNPLGSAASASLVHPPPGRPWLWSWVMPYAVQPPFAPPELAERVTYVESRWVYCCPAEQWYASTQHSIASWSAQTEKPIVVLAWDASTGDLARARNLNESCVRAIFLADPSGIEEVDGRLAAFLEGVRLHPDQTCPL